MSIFQDFERAKRHIGEEKWNSIDTYINNHHPELLLDQIIYNPDNWLEFEKWYDKEIKKVTVNVTSVWKTDYDDIRACAEIGKGEIKLGNIIASYDEDTIRNITGNFKNPLGDREQINAFAVLIASSFDRYANLPKISKCSELLQSIYDDVCQSDSTMCHITEEEWDEYYKHDYSENDIITLQAEIKKYKLDDVIEIDDGEYKIIGYGDLEIRFIDDRDLEINKESELVI